MILNTELSGPSNRSNLDGLYRGGFVLPTMATDIHFGPDLSCNVAVAAMFLTRSYDVYQKRQLHFKAA